MDAEEGNWPLGPPPEGGGGMAIWDDIEEPDDWYCPPEVDPFAPYEFTELLKGSPPCIMPCEGFEGAVGCCTGGCGCCPPIPLMAFIIGPVELLGILDGEPRLRRTVSRTGPQAGQFGSLHLR